jgi:hypothetical protein
MADAKQGFMKNTIIYMVPVVGLLALGASAFADHEKNCQYVHGTVTGVTDRVVAVDDKPYTVGQSTRITKGDKRLALKDVKTGDIVCVDTRGKGDIGNGEVAGLAILSPPEVPPKREVIREKETIKEVAHNKNCDHAHGKVTRVTAHAIVIGGDDEAFVTGDSTRITKEGKMVTLKTLKPGDFVCVETSDKEGSDHQLTSVVILKPSEAAVFEQKEVIKEKITENVPEQK